MTLAPEAAAQADQPRVLSSTYRVDLGIMSPGETRTGSFVLSNPTRYPVAVSFVQEGDPTLASLPAETILQSGESRGIPYSYAIPSDTAPGNRGESARIVVNAIAKTNQTGVGTLSAGTAILFTSRTAAIGAISVEAPRLVLPGQNVTGRIVAVNTWDRPVNATMLVEWLDANGTLLARNETASQTIGPDNNRIYDYTFTNVTATAGRHNIRATLRSADPGAPVSTLPSIQGMLVGQRSASFAIIAVRDGGDGNVTVELELRNTGNVPVHLKPRLSFSSVGVLAVDPVTLQLDRLLLEPSDIRRLTALVLLPAGDFQLRVFDDEGEVETFDVLLDTPAEVRFAMSTPAYARLSAPTETPAFWGWSWWWLLPLGFLAVITVSVRRRRSIAARVIAARTAFRARPRLGARILAVRTRFRGRPGIGARFIAARTAFSAARARRRAAAEDDELDAFLLSLEDAPSESTDDEDFDPDFAAIVADVPIRVEPRAPAPPPPQPAPVDAPIAAPAAAPIRPAAPAPMRAQIHVTLLVDVESFHATATLEDFNRAVAAHDVLHARAYLAATTPTNVRLASVALAHDGYTPVIESGNGAREAIVLRLALDAQSAAHAGHRVIIASADPAFAPLAAKLRAEELPFEWATTGSLPDAVRPHVQALHRIRPSGDRDTRAR